MIDNGNHWDLIVVGGGVTGAGIFHEASRRGLKTLLLEKQDFAWGTSSRSSKMVHGGLRYLKEGKIFLTLDSVKERERLLREAPGLINPLTFFMPIYKGCSPSKMTMGAGLILYSLMAGEKQYEKMSARRALGVVSHLKGDGLDGAFLFRDAQVDDARLVLRLIQEGRSRGSRALNYTGVTRILRDRKGRVAGVEAQDTLTGKAFGFNAHAVINASGAWAETLHPSPVKDYHLRPLRGSHLIFPGQGFPREKVLSFIHPKDSRPVFIFPWEGCALLGTTDVDHGEDMDMEPSVSREEAGYLMEGLAHILPGVPVTGHDCISSMAGVRPVLSQGKKSASQESREHVIWKNKGLVTVTGGKLTTFRLLAGDAIAAISDFLPSISTPPPSHVFDSRISPPGLEECSLEMKLRLLGRFGIKAGQVARIMDEDGLSQVGETATTWAELAYSAGHEKVRRLSDLLLRRTRLGLLLPRGGAACLTRIRAVCQNPLGWDDNRWEQEEKEYLDNWQRCYAPPFSSRRIEARFIQRRQG